MEKAKNKREEDFKLLNSFQHCRRAFTYKIRRKSQKLVNINPDDFEILFNYFSITAKTEVAFVIIAHGFF